MAAIIGLLVGLGGAASAAEVAAIELSNGKNLDGWVAMHGGEWVVEDGVIVGRQGTGWSTDPEKSGSWLRSQKEYADFVWEFEYAINDLEIPVASHKPGGTFHLEAHGIDVTGPITIPDTGGWNILKTIRHPGLVLKKGPQTLTVVMDSEGSSGSIGDIDLLRFSGPRKAE
jgi:hypothetical protein